MEVVSANDDVSRLILYYYFFIRTHLLKVWLHVLGQ